MAKPAKSSSAKARSHARQSGAGRSDEGGQHRPKKKDSKNEGRARHR